MLKKIIFKTSLAAAIFFLTLLPGIKASAETATPTILNTALMEIDGGWKISVSGLTKPNNSVLIYINGSYEGLANISKNNTNFDNFSYLSPPVDQNSSFQIFAIAKNNSTGELSPVAQSPVDTIIKKSSQATSHVFTQQKKTTPQENQENKLKTKILEKVATPTLVSPAGQSTDKTPLISGFSMNGTIVEIYLDNQKIAEIPAKESGLENTSFEYRSTQNLSVGNHKIYVIAKKDDWNKSDKSNILSFSISEPIKEVLGTKETSNQGNVDSTTATVSQKKTPQASENTELGQKKISIFNIILFCIFIISVLVWVIAIARELKKEPQKNKQDSQK